MTINEKLKYLRKDCNLTIRAVSKLTGVSNPYICQIESGRNTPTIRILKALSLAYGFREIRSIVMDEFPA